MLQTRPSLYQPVASGRFKSKTATQRKPASQSTNNRGTEIRTYDHAVFVIVKLFLEQNNCCVTNWILCILTDKNC